MPGGYAASDSAAIRPTASVDGHRLLRAEEGLARRHRERPPRGRRRERPGHAVLVEAEAARRPGCSAATSRSPRCRSRSPPCRTPPRRRSRRPARSSRRRGRHQLRRPRSRSPRCRVRRPRAAAGRSRTRRAGRPCARRARRGPAARGSPGARSAAPAIVSSSSSGRSFTAKPPRGVERPQQQRVRAGRLDQRHGAVDAVLVDPAFGGTAEMDHRRLGEAADDLVRARHDEVRARRERVHRQPVVEREVGAPRLVHDQRHAMRVGDLAQPAHVGDRAEVGRRHDERAHRAGRRGQRPVERLRGRGSGRSRAPGRAPAPRTPAAAPTATRPSIVLEWTLRCTTTCSPACASARHATWLPCEAPLMRNHVRRAPHASAASCCARWNGVGSAPASMPSISAGMSSSSARSPKASTIAGFGRRTALVAGHVEAPGPALGVRAQRVEVGHRLLGARLRHAPECRRGTPRSAWIGRPCAPKSARRSGNRCPQLPRC